MRRRHALLATTAGAALVGGLLVAPQAHADEEEPAPASPSLCIELDITIQDQQVAESICLPPDGGGEPGLPGLPELPFLTR
jgi:hypothetical protein